jgi:hypothetical protein
LPTEVVDELRHQTQALEIEPMRSENGRKEDRRVGRVVRRAQCDGGMAAVGQTHDDVRAFAAADADYGQLLSAERVMGMGDGHESQRELGGRGSAL